MASLENLQTCTICIDEFTDEAIVKFSNCQHGLCAPCHREYLLTSNKCPVCRAVIQDPNELFLQGLERLSVFLAKTNDALRRVHTAGAITIVPNSDTALQLKEVQNKIQQLSTLMADTGIAYVGTPNAARYAERFQQQPNGIRQSNMTTSTSWGTGSNGEDGFQVDLDLIAMALASAGARNISSATSSSGGVPSTSTRRAPSTSTTYTTDIFVSGFNSPSTRPPTLSPTVAPQASSSPSQSPNPGSSAAEPLRTTRRRAAPRPVTEPSTRPVTRTTRARTTRRQDVEE